jgi:hypothetical protein
MRFPNGRGTGGSAGPDRTGGRGDDADSADSDAPTETNADPGFDPRPPSLRDRSPTDTRDQTEPGSRTGGGRSPVAGDVPPSRISIADRVSADVEAGESVPERVSDGLQSGLDSARSTGADIQDTLPGRTGEAAALGATVAAVPEPTPVTEVTGATIAGGALLVGGGILASRAARNELEIGERIPDELETGRSRQEIREMQATDSTGIMQSELEATAGTAQNELDVGAPRPDAELDITDTGDSAPTSGRSEESVVPGEFPLPGRDIARNPRVDAPEETSPDDVVGGAETATGVAIGREESTGGGTTGGSVQRRQQQNEMLREILDVDDDVVLGEDGGGFVARRDFPTGAGAVIGRELQRTEQSQAPGVEATTAAGLGIGAGSGPRDPLGPLVDDRTRAGGGGAFGTGRELTVGAITATEPGQEPGVGIEPGTATDTATETQPATETATATDTALDQQLALREETALGTQQLQDLAFENPTLNPEATTTEPVTPGTSGGGDGGGDRLERPVRFDFDDDESALLPPGFASGLFESPTQSLGDIDEELSDIGSGGDESQ